MTILFFSRLFYPHIGGVEKHIYKLARKLAERKMRVIVISEAEEQKYQSMGESAKEDNINDFGFVKPQTYRKKNEKYQKKKDNLFVISLYLPVFFKNEHFKKWYIWWWLFRNRDLIAKADIIHCHDVFFWYLPFRILYPRKKVFTTFHGYETIFPPSIKAITVRKLSEILSSGNICVGDYIKKWYGTNPNYVTYGGVEKAQNAKLKVKSYNKKLKILFIGRLEKDTGVLAYLKSLELLGKKGVKFEFEACGDGTLRGEVEKFGKVHGFVSELSPYLSWSNIVFASSYLSILESLSAKRLTCSLYANALKEDYLKLSPFTRYIIVEGAPEKLAVSIVYLLRNNRKRKEIVDKGYHFAKHQTWDAVTDMYVKLWGTQ